MWKEILREGDPRQGDETFQAQQVDVRGGVLWDEMFRSDLQNWELANPFPLLVFK